MKDETGFLRQISSFASPQLRTLLVLGLCLGGCAPSSRSIYGGVARYQAGARSWVASAGSKQFVIRSPVTQCVVRCRADVERFKDLAADVSRVRNTNQGANGNGFLVVLPLSVPAFIFGAPGALLAKAFREDDSAQAYRARADVALARGDRVGAEQGYLLALAHGSEAAGEPLATLWAEAGRADEAKQLRRMMACQGVALGEKTWAKIEAWLDTEGASLEKCADPSTEPVEMPWLE